MQTTDSVYDLDLDLDDDNFGLDDFGLDDDDLDDLDDDLGMDDLGLDDDLDDDDLDDDLGLDDFGEDDDDLDDLDDDLGLDDDFGLHMEPIDDGFYDEDNLGDEDEVEDEGDEEFGQDDNGSFGFLVLAPLLAVATASAATARLTVAHQKKLIQVMPYLKRSSLTKIANNRLRLGKVRNAARNELARRQRGGQMQAWPAQYVSRRQVTQMPGLPRYIPRVARQQHVPVKQSTTKLRQQYIQLQARRAAAAKARQDQAAQRRAAHAQRPQRQHRPVAVVVKNNAGKVQQMLQNRKAAHAAHVANRPAKQARPARPVKPAKPHNVHRRGNRNEEGDSMGGIAGSMFATVALLAGTFAAGTYLGPKLVEVVSDKAREVTYGW